MVKNELNLPQESINTCYASFSRIQNNHINNNKINDDEEK